MRGAGCIVSLQNWRKRDAMGQCVDAVVEQWAAPDDRTLEIQLTPRFPLLLDARAKADASVLFIMQEQLTRTDAMEAITEVLGSGPCRLLADELVSGARIASARFDLYKPPERTAELGHGRQNRAFPPGGVERFPYPATAAAARPIGRTGRLTICCRRCCATRTSPAR